MYINKNCFNEDPVLLLYFTFVQTRSWFSSVACQAKLNYCFLLLLQNHF